MKKFLLFLSFIMVVFISGCGRTPVVPPDDEVSDELVCTFDANGGEFETGLSTFVLDIKTVSQTVIPNSPTRVGHHFDGWYLNADVITVTYLNELLINPEIKEVTVTAKWVLDSYTVTFNSLGGELVSGKAENIIEFGGELTQPVYEKEAHLFAGWFFDNVTFNNPFNISAVFEMSDASTVTVYAKWIKNGYGIMFSEDGGTLVSGRKQNVVESGDELTLPVYEKFGYSFEGWFFDSETFNNAFDLDLVYAMPTLTSVTVYAKWVKNSYTITFDSLGGTLISGQAVNNVLFGDALTLPVYEKEGYTFVGWFFDNESLADSFSLASVFQMPTDSNITVWALWVLNSYTVTFDGLGGSINSGEIEHSINFGETLTIPEYEKVGHSLEGWFFDNETFNIPFNIDLVFAKPTLSSVTVYAKWKADSYTISFDALGGTITSGQVENDISFGESLTLPVFEKEGNHLTGWFFDQGTWHEPFTLEALFAMPTLSSVIVYAKWDLKAYSITFNGSGGNFVSGQTNIFLIYGNEPVAPIFAKEGYSFDGWFFDQDVWAEPFSLDALLAMPSGIAVEVYLKWKVNSYTVTFDSLTGTLVSGQAENNINFGETLTLPVFEKEGNHLTGWYFDKDTWHEPFTLEALFAMPDLSNVTVYAKWDLKAYSITFNGSGGNFVSGQTNIFLIYGNEPVTPIFAKEGYNFDGWFFDQDVWAEPFSLDALLAMPSGIAVEVYIKWKIKSYTVIFDGLGGTLTDGQAEHNIVFGESLVLPVYTKTEHVFEGWFFDQGTWLEAFSLNSVYDMPTLTSVTVYAKWKVNTYTVTFHVTGGTLISGQEVNTVNYGGTCVAPGYEREGYELSTWTPDFSFVTQDLSVWATWQLAPGTEGLVYSYDSSGYTVTGYIGTTANVYIPLIYNDGINGSKNVVGIGDEAFMDCLVLTNVTIPSTVQSVGVGAFKQCYDLLDIVLPEGLTIINNDTFNNCRKLRTAIIPSSVTIIGDNAFSACWKLETAAIPNGVTSIGDYAFASTKIKNIIIPNSVTYLGRQSFRDCPSAKTLILSNSITSIEKYTFTNCDSITTVDIPLGVVSIAEGAFNRCGNLENVTIPSSVTSIGSSAFGGCTSLTNITISSGLISIESSAFSGCTSLTSIIIPLSVTSIEANAFWGCIALTIKIEALSIPSGWDADFNPGNRPVEWGYTG